MCLHDFTKNISFVVVVSLWSFLLDFFQAAYSCTHNVDWKRIISCVPIQKYLFIIHSSSSVWPRTVCGLNCFLLFTVLIFSSFSVLLCLLQTNYWPDNGKVHIMGYRLINRSDNTKPNCFQWLNKHSIYILRCSCWQYASLKMVRYPPINGVKLLHLGRTTQCLSVISDLISSSCPTVSRTCIKVVQSVK